MPLLIMKYPTLISAFIFAFAAASPASLDKRSQPQGLDVSGWQGNVNWPQVKADGASFAIIKVITLIPKLSAYYLSPHF